MNKKVRLFIGLLLVVAFVLLLGIAFVKIWTDEQINNPGSQTNQQLRQASSDTQRKNEVGMIWGAAQQYRQKTGSYPTAATINSAAFQSEYGLNGKPIASTPTRDSYAYSATAADNSACDNASKPCAKFKVAVLLSDGTEYSLTESQ